jgi:hypothetical protein
MSSKSYYKLVVFILYGSIFHLAVASYTKCSPTSFGYLFFFKSQLISSATKLLSIMPQIPSDPRTKEVGYDVNS